MKIWPKNALEWAGFSVLCLTGAFIFVLLINAGQMSLEGRLGDKWDVLAFSGSIIGGVITLLGVRIGIGHTQKTLEAELNRKNIEDAAIKSRLLDKMLLELKVCHDSFYVTSNMLDYESRNISDVAEVLRKIDKSFELDKITHSVDNSVKVDADVYRLLHRLEAMVSTEIRNDRVTKFRFEVQDITAEEAAKEIIISLGDLSFETQKTLDFINQKRREYLKVLFPNTDPQSITFDGPY